MLRWIRAFITSPTRGSRSARPSSIVFGSTPALMMGSSSRYAAPAMALRKNGRSGIAVGVPNSFQAATAATGVPSG